MKLSYLLIIILLFDYTLFAQKDISIYYNLKKEYPEESYIQLSKKVHYRIKIENEKLDITLMSFEKFIYLKNASGLSIDRSVYTSEFSELVSYSANSYIIGKNRYIKIPVTKYNEKMNVNGNSFYDDVKELNFTFPGVTEGTIIELNTTYKIHEPRLLNTIFLEWFYPISEYEVIFECDKNVKLELIKMNMPENDGDINIKHSGDLTIYYWKSKNIHEINTEKNSPDIRYYAAHFIPVIRSYKANDLTIDVLTNCKSLYQWYYKFIENFDTGMNAYNLQKIADSVTFGIRTELEKVEKLYYWVQENIKYISFEYGLGGFIPRRPDVILKNHYGDCKDKAAILYTLLRLSGIKSYFTWIGTNDIPYTYKKVSSPVTDNHMVVTYIHNDDYYFLDGTGKYLPIKYPTSFIQGKEGLIAVDKDSFQIKEIPVSKPDLSLIHDITELNIDDQKLTGKSFVRFSGYNKMETKYGYTKSNDEDKMEFIEDRLEIGNNKFRLSSYDICSDQISSPFEINYTFEIDNYVKKLNNELFINLNLNRKFLGYSLPENRKNPLIFDYCYTLKDEYKLKIPEGYTIGYMPENDMKSGENLDYSVTYSISGDTIIYRQEITLKDMYIEHKDFEEWRNMTGGLEKIYKYSIHLKKNED